MTTAVRATGRARDELPAGVPDEIVAGSLFERDDLDLIVNMKSPGTARGPVRVQGVAGGRPVSVAAGLVTARGFSESMPIGVARRGKIASGDWVQLAGDPLGLFSTTRRGKGGDLGLVLPRFTSLRDRPPFREVEAAITAPRAGSGTEIFGVREYRPGDALRRIHWRSTARRGELIVREFEPPGVQNLGIFLDSHPAGTDAADQAARLAASEAWDCLQGGGRVTLWAPGCEPSHPEEQRNLAALLEWLARYPRSAAEDEPAPLVGDAIAITSAGDARLLDAVEDVRAHGGSVRAWVVGEGAFDSDVEMQRVGVEWPL